MFNKKITGMAVAAVSIGLLAGCGGGKTGTEAVPETKTEEPPKPVTLKVYTAANDSDFEKYYNQFVKKKFPHVTLERMEKKAQPPSVVYPQMLAAGTMPDIITEGLTNLAALKELDLMTDLGPLAKKHGFNFEPYNSKIIESIKSYGEKGEMYYLPFSVLGFALHYNKDIFDRFGVPYPKDFMTWDDVIEIGKQLTRVDSGVQYVGIRPPLQMNRMSGQLSLPYADASSKKSLVNSAGWRQLFEMTKQIEDAQGKPPADAFFRSRDVFMKNKTIAMLPDILALQNVDMVAMANGGLNWDVVTFPSFKENPRVGTGVFSDGFTLPKGGKNEDIAFQVIAYLSSDQEVQTNSTRSGLVTALNDAGIRDQAFADHPAAKGKNLKHIFDMQYPTPARSTTYDSAVLGIMNKYLVNFINGTTDVNSALRDAAEEADKKIAELSAK
ncbi:ABC transporter substrate-binding protein [Paenibacillus oceani]|uniref:Extracellular solute-binding protein n=1 Tax=Paenibacillus oceani TaxID=2772510 RepID=A0A927CAY9_9BACL|nr:extracellular solute-binding protein [Paenibacillus oceani]MBD2862676.1 extracellular solute-binding protein [Paenibacillus oceani]